MNKLYKIINEELKSLINDNFKKWFGNSKVVDKSNRPLVVYRTQKKEIPHGSYMKSKYVYGIYFSENKESTKIYGDITEGYYLSLQNPKILRGFKHNEPWNLSIITKDKYLNLIKNGYDGAIWLKDGEMYEIVALDPKQIKSIKNNGTWGIGNDIYS